MNVVIISGNLAQDPFVRGNGNNVVILTVASNKEWLDRSTGEKQQRTDFIPVTFFGKTAEFAAKYLKKGRHVEITGELTINKWEDKNAGGKMRYDTEVHGLTLKPTGPNPHKSGEPAEDQQPSYAGFDEQFDGDFSRD